MRSELIKKLFEASLEVSGARNLTSNNVEHLIEYSRNLPKRMHILEAKMIEPQFDREMFNYSISGPLPSTGRGIEEDKKKVISLFREINETAQKEPYPIRYNVWFGD